jgi:hypothetical protein
MSPITSKVDLDGASDIINSKMSRRPFSFLSKGDGNENESLDTP